MTVYFHEYYQQGKCTAMRESCCMRHRALSLRQRGFLIGIHRPTWCSCRDTWSSRREHCKETYTLSI